MNAPGHPPAHPGRAKSEKSAYQFPHVGKKVDRGITPGLRRITVKQALNIRFLEKQFFPSIQVWPIIWNRRNLSPCDKCVQGRTANPQPLHHFFCRQQYFRHMPVSLRKTSGTTFTKYTVLAIFCQGLDIFPYNIYNTGNTNNVYVRGTATTVPQNASEPASTDWKTMLTDSINCLSASIVQYCANIVKSEIAVGGSEVIQQ